jgi:hypothetical protein
MEMKIKKRPYIIPEYSITGDILSYHSCGLQYRLQNKGELPPARPVQLWFGQFIHGSLEEAYLRWKKNPNYRVLPLDWASRIRDIEMTVYKRLAAGGVRPPPNIFCPYDEPNEKLGGCPDENHPHKLIASKRVERTLEVWAPHLFPLISEAEVKLKGTRPMPNYSESISRSRHYGITGIVDVLASVKVASAGPDNLILKKIREEKFGEELLQEAAQNEFDIIIDYKGMARPKPSDAEWNHHYDQVMTYAWLREKQLESNRVRVAIIFYLNELVPSESDLKKLQRLVLSQQGNSTDDLKLNSQDLASLKAWNGATHSLQLSPESMINRSIRIIQVNKQNIDQSLRSMDGAVSEIENSVIDEMRGKKILETWKMLPRDETCTICDFKTFCPKSSDKRPPRITE